MNFNFDEWIKKFNASEVDDTLIEFGRWKEKYYNLPVVDVMHELSEKTIEVIKKLGIELKEKVYTEYEFDVLEMNISDYYIFEGMTEEELSYIKSLEGTGLTNNDIEEALHEIYKISKEHNF